MARISRRDYLSELRISISAYKRLEQNARVYEDAEEDYDMLLERDNNATAPIEVILGIKLNLEELVNRYLNLVEARKNIFLLTDLYDKYFGDRSIPKRMGKFIDYLEAYDPSQRNRDVIRLSNKISILNDVLKEVLKPKKKGEKPKLDSTNPNTP